jgi:hypothetical protein
MKIKSVFLFYFFLCFFSKFTWAQAQEETRLMYVGIETGMTFIESDITNMNSIRGDVPSYSNGYSTNSLTTLTYKSFIGIKSEIFSLNDRFGLSAGLRYSGIISSLGKGDYMANSTNYFYWLYSQDGVNTEYLRVKEINQKSKYIGIPVELRFFPARRPHLFRIYAKLGVEINCLLQTKTDVVFYDNAMDPYKNDIIAKIEKPSTFYSSIYGGGGIRIGRDLKPSVSLEICMPYLFLTPESTGLVNPIFGGGFQLNVQIPIK